MPTYVYECRRCGHRFEILQSITDPPRRRCPECRGAVKRIVMPGGGLVFKGSGFYITDYKRKGEAAPGTDKASSGDAEPAKSGDESKSDQAKKDT